MKKFLLGFGLFSLAAIAGSIYYTWNQLTQLPPEYVESNSTKPQSATQIQAEAAASQAKIKQQVIQSSPGQKVEVEINDRDLNNILVSKLATTNNSQPLSSGVKVVNSKIKDGKIQAGAVVNLSELSKDNQHSGNLETIQRLTDKLPLIKERDIYVGIEGKPIVQNGEIKFDRTTTVKVGKMSMTIADIAENLGVSEAKIEQLMNLKLAPTGIKIDRIDLDKNRLKIAGEKQ